MSSQASAVKHSSLALLSRPQRCIYHCYYSFREALPGLIGSSWSQNPQLLQPLVRLTNCPESALGFSVCMKSCHAVKSIQSAGAVGPRPHPLRALTMAGEGTHGEKPHQALLSTLWGPTPSGISISTGKHSAGLNARTNGFKRGSSCLKEIYVCMY